MKVYVAASSTEYLRARKAMVALTSLGATIAADWTPAVEAHGSGGGNRKANAAADMAGVLAADVLLALLPDRCTHSPGMWIEVGAALATGKRVILAGQPSDPLSIFVELAEEHFPDDATAIVFIVAHDLGGRAALPTLPTEAQ